MLLADWINNAVIYQVFIDRFDGFDQTENSPNFLGGDLKGIITKLDYLQNLGINVIWLSPFYGTDKYHGYSITDFKKVDSHFGSTKNLIRLINEAKKREIKVIADFVPNHCSIQHPFFQDAVKSRSSKYFNWFVFKKWPNEYLSFLDFKELPKLNLENKDTQDYIIEIADFWLSFGIDGFRIDHAIGPSHSFWKEFRQRIKSKYPKAVLIGEAWVMGIKNKHFKTLGIKKKIIRKIFGISQEKIQLEYYGEFDGVLDFSLNNLLVNSIKKDNAILTNKELEDKIRKHFKRIPDDYTMVTFLDNHDMDRFLRHCNGNIQTLLNAFELLFSLDYPVVIYNGTENCVFNKSPVNVSLENSDLQVREPIDWGILIKNSL